MKKAAICAAAVTLIAGFSGWWLSVLAIRQDAAIAQAIESRIQAIQQRCELECQREDLQLALLRKLEFYDPEDAIRYAPSEMSQFSRTAAARLFELLVKNANGDYALALDRFFDGEEVDADPVARSVDIPALLALKSKNESQQDSLETATYVAAGISALAAASLTAMGIWALWLAMVRSTRRAWLNPDK